MLLGSQADQYHGRNPKSAQLYAKKLIHVMYLLPTKEEARKVYHRFLFEFLVKHPKEVKCQSKDEDVLFTFHYFPAEYWRHLRSTNPI